MRATFVRHDLILACAVRTYTAFLLTRVVADYYGETLVLNMFVLRY